MWPSSASATATRHINCGLPPEFFFVTPASFQHHHHHAEAAAAATTINFDPHNLNASNAIGVGVGVIPLLTASPCLAQQSAAADEDSLNNARSRGGGGMQLWQHQQLQESSSPYLKKPLSNVDHSSLLHSGSGGGASSAGATTCQDCGNQAKKDCPHRRCRTCCKSRGFDCSTHVKSTWVPAARRRERQLMGGTSSAAAAAAAAAGSSHSTSSTKKPRLGGASQTTTASHTSTSNTTPPRSFETSSSHLVDEGLKESLPGQVRAPAVFKCVRVTALDDGDDEYAYQAIVRIGGHVFKGFLYDQGFEGREGFPNISELHLGGVGAASGGRNGASSSHPSLDPSELYGAASGGGMLGGSNYGNQIN